MAAKSVSSPAVTETLPTSSSFTFIPYKATFRHKFFARVTEKVSDDVYLMRDTEQLVTLYQHIARPTKRLSPSMYLGDVAKMACIARVARPLGSLRTSRCRLYRAVASQFSLNNGTCSAFLVDYGQHVICESFGIYSLRGQPSTVMTMPVAAFRFGIKLQRNSRIQEMEIEREYVICIKACADDGTYWGKVIHAVQNPITQMSHYDTNFNESYMEDEDNDLSISSIKRSIQNLEEKLHERSERLQTERELFELTKSKREQELAVQTLQLQCATILKKLDAVRLADVGNLCNSHTNLPSIPIQFYFGNLNAGWNSSTAYQPLVHTFATNLPSVSLPNGNLMEPARTQQFPTTLSDLQRNLNTLTAQQIMGTYPVCFNDNEFNRNPSTSSAPAVSVRESTQPSSLTSTLRYSPSLYNAQPGHSRDYGNKVSLSADHNDFQQRRWNLAERNMASRRTQYGEPPVHFVSEISDSVKSQDCVGMPQRTSVDCSPLFENGASSTKYNSNRNEWKGTFYSSRNGESGRRIYLNSESNKPVLKKTPFWRQQKTNMHCNKSGLSVQSTLGIDFSSYDKSEKNIKGKNDENGMKSNEENPSAAVFSSGRITKTLKYSPYVSYMEVMKQKVYVVKRSDDDWRDENWPLFFVQIQDDALLDITEEYLDCLNADQPLEKKNLKLGQLCVSYCHKFKAMFRAVITAIFDNEVEVLYIDYGNYERVAHDMLRSIDELSEMTRMHPAMGIPCLLSNIEDADTGYGVSMEEDDILHFKKAVSCDKPCFKLKFLRKRADGVMVVELA